MSSSGTQRQLTLAPAPESARAARRFVSEVLSSARAGHFEDAATLLTSELVTNGIVHAHTEMQVLVEATPTWVRVEVVDGNPRLPVRRDYDEHATTGRGVEMIELLADDFGVEPLEDDGKRVWFRLGAVPGTPHAVVPTDEDDTQPRTVAVQLLNLPITLYIAWQQHAEALLREATLSAFDDAEGPDGHPDFPLATRALGALADAASEIFALREEDVATSDVTLHLDAASVPYFPILRELLVTATAMSVAGQLLVPPSLPEIVALRRWLCDEVARQSAGLEPTAWADYDVVDDSPLAVAPATLAEVRDAEEAVMAADASNRIIAVSRQAAELLGWSVEELEGRRLVTIMPVRMRDKHVAGFTRYLLEGTSEIIGRPFTTKALHRDGHEIDVTLLVERHDDPATRALFVAHLLGD